MNNIFPILFIILVIILVLLLVTAFANKSKNDKLMCGGNQLALFKGGTKKYKGGYFGDPTNNYTLPLEPDSQNVYDWGNIVIDAYSKSDDSKKDSDLRKILLELVFSRNYDNTYYHIRNIEELNNLLEMIGEKQISFTFINISYKDILKGTKINPFQQLVEYIAKNQERVKLEEQDLQLGEQQLQIEEHEITISDQQSAFLTLTEAKDALLLEYQNNLDELQTSKDELERIKIEMMELTKRLEVECPQVSSNLSILYTRIIEYEKLNSELILERDKLKSQIDTYELIESTRKEKESSAGAGASAPTKSSIQKTSTENKLKSDLTRVNSELTRVNSELAKCQQEFIRYKQVNDGVIETLRANVSDLTLARNNLQSRLTSTNIDNLTGQSRLEMDYKKRFDEASAAGALKEQDHRKMNRELFALTQQLTKEKDDLQRNFDVLQSRFDGLQIRFDDLQSTNDLLTIENTHISSELTTANATIGDRDIRIQKMTDLLNTNESQLVNMGDNLNSAQQLNTGLQQLYTNMKAQLDTRMAKLKQKDDELDVVNAANQKLSNQHKQLKRESQQEIAGLRGDLRTNNDLLEKSNAELVRIQTMLRHSRDVNRSLLDKINILESKNHTNDNLIIRLEQTIVLQTQEISRLKEKIDNLRLELDNLRLKFDECFTDLSYLIDRNNQLDLELENCNALREQKEKEFVELEERFGKEFAEKDEQYHELMETTQFKQQASDQDNSVMQPSSALRLIQMAAGKTLNVLSRIDYNEEKRNGLQSNVLYFVPLHDTDLKKYNSKTGKDKLFINDLIQNAKPGYYYTLNDGELTNIY